MSAAAGTSPAVRRGGTAAGEHNPWLIAGVVSIATFMAVLDVSVANVSLRNIAGSLGISYDEATWVITSYLVANAAVLPLCAWLSTVIGRKRFYMIAVAAFTLGSFLCGIAWNLNSLIFFRVLQGIGGAGLAPSEQSILADTFPPEKRGQAFALYGLAVVVAPTVGPTLGGWLTDNASWHWIFFINIPMGIMSLALVGALISEPASTEAQRKVAVSQGVDWVGFLLVALGLGCLEVVMDEGQRQDWFASSFITGFAAVSAVSLIATIGWELSRKYPMVDIRLIGHRQFGACFLVMMVTAGVLISTTQFMPQLLQEQFGYTATLAGLSLSPGGLVLMVMMPVAGYVTGKVQPKWLIAMGLSFIGLTMWHLTGLDGNLTFSYAVYARVFMSLGLPFLFIPITAASYAGLPPDKTTQAAGLINVARNLGGSIFTAAAQTMLQQREQFHHAQLAADITPTAPIYRETLSHVTNYFTMKGAPAAQASHDAIGWIAQTLQKQAVLLSYIDVFFVLAIVCAAAVPLAFLLKPAALGGSRASGEH